MNIGGARDLASKVIPALYRVLDARELSMLSLDFLQCLRIRVLLNIVRYTWYEKKRLSPNRHATQEKTYNDIWQAQ